MYLWMCEVLFNMWTAQGLFIDDHCHTKVQFYAIFTFNTSLN